MKKLILLAIFAIAVLLESEAQTWTWTGDGDGTTWQDGANWDKGSVPPVDSFATFITADTITGSAASIMKLSTGEGGHALLNLDITIGDGVTAEHGVIANTKSTLIFGGEHIYNILGEASKNGFSTFAGTDSAMVIIDSLATVLISGSNNGLNNASPSSVFINRGKLVITDSKSSINHKIGSRMINQGDILVSGTFDRGLISSSHFTNDTSGTIMIEKPRLDGIEMKGDSLFNHGTIEVICRDDARSGDNGIAVGTSTDAAVLINTSKNSIIANGGIGVDGRAIYVYEAGTLHNYGRIEVEGGNDGSRFYTRGISINEAGGIIDLMDGRMNVNDGTFTNNGLVLSTRQGSAIFSTALVVNNGFYQYDSMRVFAIGSGTVEKNGIDLRDSAEVNIDFAGGLTQDVAEVAYNYYEGEVLIGSSDNTGLLTLNSSLLSGDPAIIYPEGLPQVMLTISNFEISCGETIHEEATICDGDSYDFKGEIITEAGIYRDTTVEMDCDIITILTLTVDEIVQSSSEESICAGEIYIFNDQSLTESGIYQDTMTGVNGCDSIHSLTLTVLNNEFENIDMTICEGDTMLFNGTEISEGGIYTDTLVADNGCVKYITLALMVIPYNRTFITDSICAGETYDFNGTILTESGLYIDTLDIADACRDIITLTLSVFEDEEVELEVSICPGEAYDFNGQMLTEAGIYIDTIASATGCMRIETLNLSIADNVEVEVDGTICRGESFDFNGTTLTEAGQYRDTSSNDTGCQRIEILTLVVNEPTYDNISKSVCPGVPYTFNGEILTEPGNYTDTLTNAVGCDSVVYLTLSVIESETDTLLASVCNGDTYDFNGAIIGEAGTYIDTIIGTDGCINYDMLVLSVLMSDDVIVYDTLCNDIPDSVFFDGKFITVAGTYSATFTNANGCDSVVTLELMDMQCISGVEDEIAASFKLYPNPSRDLIILENDGSFDLRRGYIVNSQGQNVQRLFAISNQSGNLRYEINISDMSVGVYFLRLETDSGISMKRFVKIR